MTLPRAKHHRQGAARGRAGDRHPGGTDLHGLTRKLRCAVYTRKSSEEGLEMEFNSLDAQREACEGLYRKPARGRLGPGCRPLRRWWRVRRHARSPCP